MRIPRIPVLAAVLLLLAAAPALADDFVPLPNLDKQPSALKIKFVRYTGGVNGEMIVDVKNTGKSSETFVAESLYFVPNGDPESAPQRLGAAGPFRAKNGKRWVDAEKLAIAPGKTKRLHLQVFCIDSHRGSPGSGQGFEVARKRLPKKLRGKINSEAKRILLENKGDMKKSKSAIQSHIWKSRDADWIKLEGERKEEKAPRKQNYQRREKNPIRQQRNLP